jgi:hypothetical protein
MIKLTLFNLCQWANVPAGTFLNKAWQELSQADSTRSWSDQTSLARAEGHLLWQDRVQGHGCA